MVAGMGGKAVILLSGGLDSAVTAAIAANEGFDLHCLTVDYGQRHGVEIDCAREIADYLDVAEHKVLELDLRAFGGSALTGNIDVPRYEKSRESIPITYVPARNLIFLSLASAWAEVLETGDIFIGINAVDYSGYPDCRPEFIESFTETVNLGSRGGIEGRPFTVHTPLSGLSKADIIKKGAELGMDFSLTRSCYNPDERGRPCGKCDSCVLRLKGFREARLEDPLIYLP